MSLFTTTLAGQLTVGVIVSSTVTVARQFAELPFPSSTVSVTLFGARFIQVNVVGGIERVMFPQLSNDPLSISAAVIVTSPVSDK